MTSTEEVTSEDLLNAQTHLWSQLFSFMNSLALKTAVELNIFDAVHDHKTPITATELAASLSIPSNRIQALQRVMRLLVHTDFFTQTTTTNDQLGEDVYALTTNSIPLIKQKGVSIAPFVEMVTCPTLLQSWEALSHWFRAPDPPSAFEMKHGSLLWDATGKIPDFGKKMREGLESDSGTVAKVVIDKCKDQFDGVRSVIEVAGGTGKLAAEIAKAFPGVKCSVLDLPHVVDVVDKSGDVDYVAGDMFVSIPSADMLILKISKAGPKARLAKQPPRTTDPVAWVMMTWNDENCVRILKRCKEAVPKKEDGGKVIIIDKVIGNSGIEHPKLTEAQIYFDIEMLVHLDGKQRTENEFKKLFEEAGFKEYKIVPALGARSVIELYH